MSFELTGNGDVLDPQFSCMAVGSGGSYALSAALALMDMELTAEQASHLTPTVFHRCVKHNQIAVCRTVHSRALVHYGMLRCAGLCLQQLHS
jgi:ATP-dependent protease HslVU (ClpYQ) peptidase subunit